jgi:transcriptional regulator with XRE-family HTH domain
MLPETQTGRPRIRLKADQLRVLAARRNETIEDLARAACIDRDHIYRLLRGAHAPTPSTRKKLLAHFGVRFDSLFAIVSAQENDNAATG